MVKERMKRNLLVCYFMYISCVFNLCYTCDKTGSNYCVVEQWAPWHLCNATCGGGVQKRQKYICCDKSKRDHSLKACLINCNIPFSWWEANATEYKTCGNCTRGGTFDSTQNSCICPLGFGGSCCDIRTTTATTTLSTTISKPTTPTTQTSLLTSSLIIMTTKPAITKKGIIISSCSGNAYKHGTCLSTNNQYFCLCYSGYDGNTCDKDIDDCASNPCHFGRCKDMVGDFHCECVVFFKGKICNKFTPLTIALISLASLAVLFSCCCFCWCILGTFDRDDEKNKVKPIKEKPRHKPMDRPPRYDDW